MTTATPSSTLIPLALAASLVACGADAPSTTATDASADASADTGPDGPTDVADAGPADTGTLDAGRADAGGDAACTSARDTALGPVASVSTGAVTLVKEEAGVRTLYVDASAGGAAAAKSNPWIYLDLGAGKRVEIDDRAALTSTAWDLAIKRPLLRVNSGDSGVGAGGAAFLAGRDLAAVSGAEAKGTAVSPERWFDETCTLRTDPTGAIKTTFDGWYVYDSATSKLTPAPGTWIVQGADGKKRFSVAIRTYYANPDATVGATSGRYVLQIAGVE